LYQKEELTLARCMIGEGVAIGAGRAHRVLRTPALVRLTCPATERSAVPGKTMRQLEPLEQARTTLCGDGDIDGQACLRGKNWHGRDHRSMIVRTVRLPAI